MDIRNIRELKKTAAQRLSQAEQGKKILLIYALIPVLASALVTLISHLLNMQIDRYGGLSHMSTRSILSTVDLVLPIVVNLAMLCLELGFLAAMLRIGRGMYTTPQTLRAGMPRFWAMIRSNLLLMCLYFAAGMVAAYISAAIYMFLPASNEALELMLPLMENASALTGEIAIDDATAMRLVDAMIPMFLIFGILYLALILPVSYRYRMASYVLVHDPAAGARQALRQSKQMMRGNCMALFRLDLSMWWYYALTFLATLICYGDSLLALLGVQLPVSGDAAFYLCYAVYLAVTFCITCFFRGRVEVAYAMAFDSIRPKEENTGGVVLGNIFQM